MSGFIRGFLLSVFASKIERLAYRRGHHPAVNGLLRELSRHLAHGHRRGYRRGHRGHYRYHGHYRG